MDLALKPSTTEGVACAGANILKALSVVTFEHGGNGWTRTIVLRCCATGECTQTLVGHSNTVNSIRVSENGASVLTSSRDKTAKLWDLATSACIRTFLYDIVCSRILGFSSEDLSGRRHACNQGHNYDIGPRNDLHASLSRGNGMKLYLTATNIVFITMSLASLQGSALATQQAPAHVS